MAKICLEDSYKPEKEKNLAALSEKLGVKIKLPCDGKGKCGKCLVKIVSGKVNSPTKEEEKHLKPKQLEEGIRLACCVIPKEDITFSLLK